MNMKNRNFIFYMLLCVGTLCLNSCISKEQEAFQKAIQSREISQIRQFLEQYPNADSLLLDSAKVILDEWSKDSIDFAELMKTEDIVERAGLEMSYMDQHPEGLYLDSVKFMYQSDELEAAAIIERKEAIEQHLESYRKQFVNKVFTVDAYHFIVLSAPDEEGNGVGTMVDGLLTYYDFRYSIDIENLEEDEISCEFTAYGSEFTLELYDKQLIYTRRDDIVTYYAEKSEELYESFLERMAKINKGEKVFGNPLVP